MTTQSYFLTTQTSKARSYTYTLLFSRPDIASRVSPFAMSSTSRDNNFAHYICTGDYPLGANRLLIGVYFEASPHRPAYNWGCFIAASFYDRQNRVVWHKTICLVLRTEGNTDRGRGWSVEDRLDTGLPPPRDYPLRVESGELM